MVQKSGCLRFYDVRFHMQDTAARDKAEDSDNQNHVDADADKSDFYVGDGDDGEVGYDPQWDSKKSSADVNDGSSDESEDEEGSYDTDEEVCLCHGLLGVIVRNGYSVGGHV